MLSTLFRFPNLHLVYENKNRTQSLVGAFLETAASRAANLVLVLEIAMGIGLLFSARLARKGRFREHAWCQSAIVLLNLAVVAVMMIPSFRVHVLPESRPG